MEGDGPLPQGVVTFLFTDVAGSTRLWEQAPAQMGPAMAQHDALVESAVRAHDGQLVRPRGEGDSRFGVFARASDAVAAALDVQRALREQAWPTPRPVQVRLALHTGEADVRDGDYYGRSVNRCARLRGLGHPGQVLVSRATADLVLDALPDGAALEPLGLHALPDLLRPEEVFQLRAPGLPATFPPLRSGAGPGLEVRVLGPVEVLRGGTPLELGGPARRGVLARLAAEPGRAVAREELLAAGWERAPGPRALQDQVAALRALLEPVRSRPTLLVTRPPGYALQVGPGTVDLQRFEVLASDARKELADGRVETAARGLADALALWRGDAFAGTPLAGSLLAAHLDEQRLECREDLHEAQLAGGAHGALVRPLEALLAVHPRRERSWGHLALALHRSGAHAAALAALDRASAAVPGGAGPELLDLARRLRAQDPALGGPPGSARPRVRLPVPATPLIGREDEVADLLRRLGGGGRLVTVTGAGGAGKTRLAVEVAARWAAARGGDVVLVPLAAESEPDRVLPAVAAALELAVPAGGPLVDALAVALGGEHALLVLDNLEQVRGVGSVVAALLEAAPALRVLATSRAPLRLHGEQEHPLGPLPPPEPGTGLDEARANPAVALFDARARAVRPDFGLDESTVGDVQDLCRRLDGLPLALELAAARVALLTPREMLARLDSQLRLLVGGARDLPDRQRTLRATIDWSHALLDPGPARLLARLSVFAEGFDLLAAEEVGGSDDVLGDLTALVGSSLVHRTVRGCTSRFRLLQSVREYAAERLRASDEEDDARLRLAGLLVDVVERAQAGLDGPRAADLLADLRLRAVDLRETLAWLAVRGQTQTAARLAVGLRSWWLLEGRLTEGRTALDRVLELDLPPAWRARVLLGAGVLAYFQDDLAQAGERLRAARDLAGTQDEETAATALGYLGAVGLASGLVDEAAGMAEQALRTALRRDLYEVHTLALSLSAVVAAVRGDVAAERALYVQRLALARSRADCRRIAETLNNLAEIALLEGDRLAARTAAEEALDLARGVARLVTRDVLLTLARVELVDEAPERAAGHVALALQLSVELGQEFEVAQGLLVAAALAGATGDHGRAAELFGAGTRLRGDRSPLDLDLEPDLAAQRDRTREALGDPTFAVLSEAGADLPRAAALARAGQPTR